jgi:hypothetical protein
VGSSQHSSGRVALSTKVGVGKMHLLFASLF